MDPRGYCSSTQKVTTRKGEEEGGRTYTGDPRRLLGGKGTLPSPPPPSLHPRLFTFYLHAFCQLNQGKSRPGHIGFVRK